MKAFTAKLFALGVALSITACGGDDGPEEQPPLAELPWPAEATALPDCDPFPGGFTTPTLAAASGAVIAAPSSVLVPTAQLELIDLTVLDAPEGDLDSSAEGTMTVSLPTGGEVIATSAVVGGRATAVVRFDQPGAHVLETVFDGDGRAGSIELFAYHTQLPVWTITADPNELDSVVESPGVRTEIGATLEIDGKPYPVSLRLHGGSSRYYPKKSFRLDLDDGLTDAGERHLILRSEFNDKTQLRNLVSLDLFRNGTWLPTPRSELVHLRINDRFYGVMNHVQRIDSDMLLGNGLSPSASLYEADPPVELSSPGGNLTPLEPELYAEVYQWHNGGEEYRDLIELIEDVLLQTESSFAANSADDIAIDNVLVYLAMMAAIQNHDHVRKNYYLYRDVYAPPGAERRWFKIPWDLELTLGHLWSEENDVFEEQLFVGEDIFVGEQAPERFGYYNQLIERVLSIPEYRARFLEMLDHIIANHLTEDFVAPRLENTLCRATPDLLADPNKRSDNDEFTGRVDEINAFVAGRSAFVQGELSRLLP